MEPEESRWLKESRTEQPEGDGIDTPGTAAQEETPATAEVPEAEPVATPGDVVAEPEQGAEPVVS